MPKFVKTKSLIIIRTTKFVKNKSDSITLLNFFNEDKFKALFGMGGRGRIENIRKKMRRKITYSFGWFKRKQRRKEKWGN